jgi:hypothetical protein
MTLQGWCQLVITKGTPTSKHWKFGMYISRLSSGGGGSEYGGVALVYLLFGSSAFLAELE